MIEIIKQFSNDHYGKGFVLKRRVVLVQLYVGLYTLQLTEEYRTYWVPDTNPTYNHKVIEFTNKEEAIKTFENVKKAMVNDNV